MADPLSCWNRRAKAMYAKMIEVIDDLSAASAPASRFPARAINGPQEFADYCKVGPTRVPFVTFPEAEIDKAKGAQRTGWN